MASNINKGHATKRRRSGGTVEPPKPKTAPVVHSWIHPDAIAKARKLAEGRDVHVIYDLNRGCMWVRNGSK